MSLLCRVHRPSAFVLLVLLIISMLPTSIRSTAAAVSAAPVQHPVLTITQSAETMPLAFVPNRGQRASDVQFVADIAGGYATLHTDGVLFRFSTFRVAAADRHGSPRLAGPPSTVRLQFVGAQPAPTITPHDQLPGVFNDYTGDDQRRWQANLPTYASLKYERLYPTVDLEYTGDGGNLKSTYTIAPGGDPTTIRWRYTGAQDVRLASSGDLVLTLPPVGGQPSRMVTETAPIAWQNTGAGRVDVGVHYTLAANGVIGFAVDSYDPTLPLVIDPTITTTAISGMSVAYGIAVDGAGYRYATGCSSNGARLSRFAPGSTTPLATTSFGDTADACGTDVAVTTGGQIIVAGSDKYSAETSERAFVATWTSATVMPVVSTLSTGAMAGTRAVALNPTTQTAYVLWTPAYVDLTKQGNRVSLISNGVPSTTVTVANGEDFATDLAVDGQGMLYLSAWIGNNPVVVKATLNGVVGSFPTTTIGTVLLDAANNVYVAGEEWSGSTPATSYVHVQSLTAGGQSRWTWVSAAQTGYTRSIDAALDADGGVVLVGRTNADDFPRVGGVGVPRTSAMNSAFVLHLKPNGAGIAWSDIFNATTTSLQSTEFNAVVLDNAGNAHIAGAITNNSNEGLSGLLGMVNFVPPPPSTPAPDYTTSYFVQYVDAQSAYDIGCATRATMPNKSKVIVFDFGSPRAFDANREPIFDATTPIASRGVKLLPRANKYVSMSDLKIFTAQFVRGYKSFACGTDPLPSITIVLGTTNSQICKEDKITACTLVDNNALTFQHGKAWATLVADLNRDIPGGTIIVTGGYDAEFGLGWNSAGTMEWADGYTSNRSATLYNFGDCNGCPRNTARSTWSQQQLSRLEQVYQLSWGMLWTRPLPEIFLNSYQDEWYNVIRYGREFYPDDPSMIIAGVMTDCQFTEGCDPNDETTQWTSVPYPGTEGVNNFPPKIGWRAMADTLTKSTAPDGSPNMIFKHTPRWLTDIAQQQ